MVSRKGINISGHYVVSINAVPSIYQVCTLSSKHLKRRTESYFIAIIFTTQRPSDTVF